MRLGCIPALCSRWLTLCQAGIFRNGGPHEDPSLEARALLHVPVNVDSAELALLFEGRLSIKNHLAFMDVAVTDICSRCAALCRFLGRLVAI